MQSKFQLKEEIWIAVKYGMVGVLNTIIFSLSIFALSRTELHYMSYTAAGYIIAISFSFIMNMKFTFSRFEGRLFPRAVKFLITALSLMLAAEGVQYYLIEFLELNELTGIVTGMVFYTGTGFLINRFWVFK